MDLRAGNALRLEYAYGFGPNGLVQRYYAQNAGVYYKVYTFDPDGNPVQRIAQTSLYPADTAVYDSGGLMWQDVSVNSGGACPELDAFGTRKSGTETGTPVRRIPAC
jgi:hypothetical protein